MTITLSTPFMMLISAIICWIIGKIIQSTCVDGQGLPFAIVPMLIFYAGAVVFIIITLIQI